MQELPFGIQFADHPDDTDDTKSEKAAIFLAAIGCCLAGCVWTGMYLLAFGLGLTAALPFIFVLIVGSSIAVAHFKKNHTFLVYAQITCIVYIPTLIQWSIGDVFESGFVMAWAFMGPLIALMFFSFWKAVFWQGLFLINVVITVILNDFFATQANTVSQNWKLFFFAMNLGVASIVVFAFATYFVNNALNEKKKADDLLRNILPDKIAKTLKSRSGVIADEYSNVSVLFADIVNYTGYSSEKSPAMVVSTLNDIFSRFDMLANERGLEKIKTIGDSYMLAGGLTQSGRHQIIEVADIALEMLKAIDQVENVDGEKFSLRIGIDIGPVVAGVIGHQKFAYDLWGDTVNVASRLEANGKPDRVHVSERFRNYLVKDYNFEDHGKVWLKGKGEMNTYFLIGRCFTRQ